MVQEVLEDCSLRQRLSGGPIDPREAVSIATQVADAMVAAHEAGVLHRDLKPSNVFLVPGPRGRSMVKVGDFGAVIRVGDPSYDGDGTPAPPQHMAPPQYMAPEQVLDKELDERTDIYGLGVVLFELLTGQCPFAPPSYGQLMVQLLKDEAPRVNQVMQGPPVSDELEAVVARCLEKLPRMRFRSMTELMRALEQVPEARAAPPAAPGEEEAPGPPATGTVAGRFRWPAAVLCVLLLAGLALAIWQVVVR
jgi:serine/threonine-protein kinase